MILEPVVCFAELVYRLMDRVGRVTCPRAIQVVEFSNGGYKIRNIFAEESTEYRLNGNY